MPGKSGPACCIKHRCDPVIRRFLCVRSKGVEREDRELAWWDFVLAVEAACRQSSVALGFEDCPEKKGEQEGNGKLLFRMRDRSS